MKTIDEFLDEEWDDSVTHYSKDEVRELLLNWTAQVIINQEED